MSSQYCVVCLHGLGASGDDLKPLAKSLALPGLRFVFPQAPTIPVTINHGHPMPAWYDVRDMDFASEVRSDHLGVNASCQKIEALVADEQSQFGIRPSHIFLMGFSQGGSIALELGLHADYEFAGIIGLSTLPAKGVKTFEQLSSTSKKTPLFLAHGTDDAVVPFIVGDHIQQRLKTEGYAVEFFTGAEPHTIWPEEILALRAWLQKRMR